MAKDSYVDYAKQRDAKGSQDGWARLKNWKDPLPSTGSAKDLQDVRKAPQMPWSKLKNKPTDSVA